MTIIVLKTKKGREIEKYKLLDALRKRCQTLRTEIANKKVSLIGVSYETNDEKAILVNSGIIEFHEVR